MSNDRIIIDNGTDVNSVVSSTNPFPIGGVALGSIDDPKAEDGDSNGSVIAELKGINDAARSTVPVPTQRVGVANNGVTAARYLAVNNTNGIVPKAAATTCFSIFGYSSAAVFIKIYDKATAPTAADTPIDIIGVAAGTNFERSYGSIGLPILNGLSFRITTVFADGDATAPAANVTSTTLVYTP